ncbi:MAG: BrnA antitoxin family protein [Rhizobiales bacterium]|nr:BrnA antitoxin family protein [Hyphomicrobiales bacterium]
MANPPFRTRGPSSTRDVAEAAFKSATTRPAAPAPAPRPVAPAVPNAKEQVTLRIDRDILEHFQADGPGWQERINAALRATLSETGGAALETEQLSAENDG